MDTGFARNLLTGRNLQPEELDVYRSQREAFERKFGREMVFDPNADTPQFRGPRDADVALGTIARIMGEAGLDPAAIYAFRKTRGLFPTSRTKLSFEQMREWNAAVLEYESKVGRSAAQ